MTLQDFIDANREELIGCIQGATGNDAVPDNDEIEMWICNDEGLYNWAKSEVDENREDF